MELDRLEQAFRAAHAAGDTAAATSLAAAIRSARADERAGLTGQTAPGQPQGGVAVNPQAASELGTNISGGVTGLRNGLSLGFMDNLKGAVIGGLGGGVPNADGGIDMFNYGTPVGDRYSGIRDQVRDEEAQALEAAPGPYRVGQGLGMVVPGALAAPETAGAGLLTTMGRMAGFGALEGGLQGAGQGDADTWGDMALDTAWGGGLGAVLGGTAPAVVAGARGIADPLGGIVSALMGKGSPSRAARTVARTVQRSGQGLDDVERSLYDAALDGQDMFVTADALGNPGQRTLAGIARSPGEGRAQIVDFLEGRQLNQHDRVGSFVSDALQSPETALAREQALIRDRGQTADVNYADARNQAGAVDVRGALASIDQRLAPMRQAGINGGPIDATLANYRARLAVPSQQLPPGTTSIELSDFDRVMDVKKDLSDDIGVAVRSGRNNEARLLTNLRDQLDAALEDASAGYRNANDTFRQQSRVVDAVDQGREASRTGVRTQDAVDTYRGLAPTQANAAPANPGNLPVPYVQNALTTPQPAAPDPRMGFRAGYVDPLMARIENTAPGVNAVRPLTTDKNQTMLREMAFDPDLLDRRIGRENTMFETRRQATGGSMTADNLADQADTLSAGQQMAEAVMSPRQSIVRMLGTQAGNILTGSDEKTRAMIAQALMSRDPRAALAPLLRTAMQASRHDRSAEAIMRALGQQTVGPNSAMIGP